MVFALAGFAWAGCGSRGAANDTATVTGRHSFDIVATLGAAGMGGAGSQLPATSAFTLVLDADAKQAIVGGNGVAKTVPATTTDGLAFHLDAFSVAVTSDGPCEIGTLIDYDSLDINVWGATVRGRANGSAQISCGDCSFRVPFIADVTGGPDVTAPSLSLARGSTTGPFGRPSFFANEPLPTTARAWLSTGASEKTELVPFMAAADPSLVIGFNAPNVLPASSAFTLAFDGLTDFAGHTGSATVPLRLDGFAAPLVQADGFESETGTQVGGAAILGPDAPIAPISGKQSLYIGGAKAPAIAGAKFGPSLNVRLAVQPGATKVRFSYRTIWTGPSVTGPTLDVGAVGHAPAATQTTGGPANGTPTPWPDGQVVNVSALQTQESALPADATGEVVVSINSLGFQCGFFQLPQTTGLQIDDLHVE
jgi:hypothetical protein